MRQQTNAELRVDIEELTERIRAIRIEQGLPPEPPKIKKFIGETLSFALVEEILPFRAIFVKYARLIAEGARPAIDTSKLARFDEIAHLLAASEVENVRDFARGVRSGLAAIERINRGEDISLSALNLHVKFLNYEGTYDYRSEEPAWARFERIKAEVAALKADGERYEAEIEAAKRIREEFANGEE